MRILKPLLWSLLVALLVVASAVVFVALYLGGHRGFLEAGASEALGRAVAIEGDISLGWAPRPSLVAGGVRIAGPEGSEDPPLFRAGRLEVQLDLSALLDRRIQITRLVASEAALHLEVQPDGGLDLPLPAGRQGGLQLDIDALRVLDSRLVIESAAGATQEIGIKQLDLLGFGSPIPSPDGELDYAKTTFTVAGSLSPEDASTPAARRFQVRIDGAEAVLTADGPLRESADSHAV